MSGFLSSFESIASGMLSGLGAESITYARGALTVSLQAVVEPVTGASKQINQAWLSRGDTIFHFKASELVLSGFPVAPKKSDEITYKTKKYKVVEFQNDGVFYRALGARGMIGD